MPMTTDDAVSLAAKLKGLIPMMTDLQIGYTVQRLEQYEREVGEAAVERYVQTQGEYHQPELIRLLESERSRRTVAGYARHQERLEEQRIRRYWQEVDRLIGSLSDEQLEALKANALTRLPANAARLVERRDPRKSSVLKSAIYDLVTQQVVA